MKYESVTAVVRRIKEDIQKDYRLQSVAMEGNIIGLKRASNGHYYMNLRDDNCSIHAILFASRVGRSMDGVREGDHVIVIGAVQIYEKGGSVSFIIERLFSQGIGNLQAQYEKIKAELEKDGYFADSHKKAIPRFPWTVGVLTSKTGAVLHDIHKIATERNPYVRIKLYPIPVQGMGVDGTIAAAVEKVGRDTSLDVIILARGGGSMEDLWCFNSPDVVKAMYNAEVPIISAIGHETDTTLADYAADMRAATPTHAAEMAFPSFDEIALNIANLANEAYDILDLKLERYRHDVSQVSARLQPLRYSDFLHLKQDGISHLLEVAKQRFELAHSRKTGQFASLEAALKAMDPDELVRKGYGQLEQDGKIISNIRGISKKQPLFIQMVDGTVTTDVREVTINGTDK